MVIHFWTRLNVITKNHHNCKHIPVKHLDVIVLLNILSKIKYYK